MAQGFQLLRACIENGSQTTFRQSPRVWFTEEELPVYDYIAFHLSRHGRLPSLDTLREQGLNLPRADEPPQYYVERVRDRAIWTQLNVLHPEFLRAVQTRDMTQAIHILDQMRQNAQAVNTSSEVTNIIEQGAKVIEQYEEAHRTFRLIGVTLGWECVDAVTDGGHPGDVIVLVGRPNVGKTFGLLHMLREAWISGKSVLIASMEMSAPQITRRVIGLQSGLNPEYMRKGRLSTVGHGLMTQTVAGFDDMPPLHMLIGNFKKRVSDIDRLAQETSPDIIYIDGGYLLTPDKARGGRGNRREAISDVIEELKGVANDRQRPLCTSVQFNREVKRRARAEMDLSQIGETDVIAQIATVAIGMRWGDPPYEQSRRRWEMMKNRDGALIKWETNFSMAPPDLSFTRMLADEPEQEEAPDTSHMI